MFSSAPSALPHPSSVDPSGITSGINFFEDEDRTETNIYEKQLSMQQISKEERRLVELQMCKEEVREKSESTQQIAQDISDLNQIMQDLAQIVHDQHDMVDSIEEHVERSMLEVKAGERNLRRAVASDSAKYPVAAAAIGGAMVGGPVGVAAGSLVAGVAAAIGGAFAGLYGGRALRKKVQKSATTSNPSRGSDVSPSEQPNLTMGR